MDKCSQKLVDTATSLITSMRMAEGFNEELFDDLKTSVREFHAYWRSSDTLPKPVVATLIDLPRLVEACASLYSGNVKQQIIDAFYELADEILEGF